MKRHDRAIEGSWAPVFDRLARAHAERGHVEACRSAQRAAAKAREIAQAKTRPSSEAYEERERTMVALAQQGIDHSTSVERDSEMGVERVVVEIERGVTYTKRVG